MYDNKVAMGGSIYDLPHSMREKPTLSPHLKLVWDMFNIVRTTRVITEISTGYIAFSEILNVMNEYEVDDCEERIYTIQLIQQLDMKYVEYINRLRKAQK